MGRVILLLLTVIKLASNSLQAADKQKYNPVLLDQAIAFETDSFPSQRLAKWIADRRIVLIGDSTHGSREFYRYRADISRYLIAKHGFTAVIIEGNWPAARQVDQFIKHQFDMSADQALIGFKSYFPWLWRNQTVHEFVQWLQKYNQLSTKHEISFYGMDLFSLYPSISRMLDLLKKHQTVFNTELTGLLQCFSSFNNSSLDYARIVADKPQQSCQGVAEQQYALISENQTLIEDKQDYQDLWFNSFIIRAAEKYFRMTYQADAVETWNMREQFMLQMINKILHQPNNQKVIIWAHNSHIGDARATAMNEQKRLSLGQLLRQQWGEDNVFLLGSVSYQGELLASKQWGGTVSLMKMPEAMDGSYGYLFHQLNLSRFIMNFNALSFGQFYQRFIGVVYEPKQEQLYNYGMAQIDRQFDAVLFVDKTTAVQQLE